MDSLFEFLDVVVLRLSRPPGQTDGFQSRRQIARYSHGVSLANVVVQANKVSVKSIAYGEFWSAVTCHRFL
jgi:hypothetical protein